MNKKVELKIYRLSKAIPLPYYASKDAACMDFYSANVAPIEVYPGETAVVSLGIKVAVPKGYKLTIKSRSGLSRDYGVIILNAPGTVDADYRGEVKAIVHNCGQEKFVVDPFMRICQGELEPAPQYPIREVETEDELGDTERGEGGFSSTGLK